MIRVGWRGGGVGSRVGGMDGRYGKVFVFLSLFFYLLTAIDLTFYKRSFMIDRLSYRR